MRSARPRSSRAAPGQQLASNAGTGGRASAGHGIRPCASIVRSSKGGNMQACATGAADQCTPEPRPIRPLVQVVEVGFPPAALLAKISFCRVATYGLCRLGGLGDARISAGKVASSSAARIRRSLGYLLCNARATSSRLPRSLRTLRHGRSWMLAPVAKPRIRSARLRACRCQSSSP